jgi:hypothetical protein
VVRRDAPRQRPGSRGARDRPGLRDAGALLVESVLFWRYALYVYVPETTREFRIGLKRRDLGPPLAKPASFTLFAPDGRSTALEPGGVEWSEQPIRTEGAWGIWQLRVEAGQPARGAAAGKDAPRTLFAVRTRGEVDLFARPDSGVNYRGALPFAAWDAATPEQHRFTLQVPRLERIRLNFRLPEADFPIAEPIDVDAKAPDGVRFDQRWVGLSRARRYPYEFWRLEYLELTGEDLQGLWTLTLSNVGGSYRIGCEQALPLVFSREPLMPMPLATIVRTRDAATGAPVPARLVISSPRTARQRYSGMVGGHLPQIGSPVPTGADGFSSCRESTTATV